METNSNSTELQRYIELFNSFLGKFIKGDSIHGLFLKTEDEAQLKRIVIEVNEFLEELFGKNNTYSLNIINAVNVPTMSGVPSYACVKEVIGILQAAVTKLGRKRLGDKEKFTASDNIKLITSMKYPFSEALDLLYKNYQGEKEKYIEPRDYAKDWFEEYFKDPEQKSKEILYILECNSKVIGVLWCTYYPTEHKAFLNQIESEKNMEWCIQKLYDTLEEHLLEKNCRYLVTESITLSECLMYEKLGFGLLLDNSVYSYLSISSGGPVPLYFMAKVLYDEIITKNKLKEIIEFSGMVYDDCWYDLEDYDFNKIQSGLTQFQTSIIEHPRFEPQLFSVNSYLDLVQIYGPMNKYFSRKIFIVHGRNHSHRDKIDLFLKSLGLETVVMAAEPHKGMTLPEKFEKYAQDCCFAVFILSADDELFDKKNKKDIKRARQNVILEVGYFWSSLGRKGNIAFLVEANEQMELPSDIQGLGWIPITEDLGLTKEKLRIELNAAGIPTTN